MKTNSGSLRSRFPNAISKRSKAKLSHVFRSGVGSNNGVIMASTESKASQAKTLTAQKLLNDAKQKVAFERQEKQLLAEALKDKPAGVKMKRDEKGYYYQPREKGKFLSKVRLG